MTIILSHISALQYLRENRVRILKCKEASRAKWLVTEPAHITPHEAKNLQAINRPIHVLMPKESFRRDSRKITCHVWSGALPKGSVFDSGSGFYVTSPELCFIQMAEELPLIKLIELGCEFCGTYDLSKHVMQKVPPLTTLTKLTSTVSKMYNLRGTKKAKRALRYVIENSASPMETILSLLLSLPYKLGGYGLTKPLLNYRIDLNAATRHPTSAKYYTCDLFWPSAQLAAEYDSDIFHTGSSRIAYDSMRRSELAILGIMVVSVTRPQIQSSFETEKLAKLFAERLGKQIRYIEPGFSQARFELREALFGTRVDREQIQ